MDRKTDTIKQHFTADLFDHLPMGVALFDAQDLRLLIANNLYLKSLDMYLDPCWCNGKSIGHPITTWLPDAEATGVVALFRSVAETGTLYRIDEYALPIPTHGMTYWNWTLDPVCDSDGHPVQLLLAIKDITADVLARQQRELAQASLTQANRAVEAERQKLEVIEAVARSVRESLDIESIGRTTVNKIWDQFKPMRVSIHIDDPARQGLRLLAMRTTPDAEKILSDIQFVPYDSLLLLARASKARHPLIIEDLASSAAVNGIKSIDVFRASDAHGYISVPLLFKDHFEGTLSAIFRERIQYDGPEAQSFVGCSTHIAAALAHTRLLVDVQNQHARLRTTLDQLPEGILLVEASDGFISYANAAAAHILGIPVISLVGVSFNSFSQDYSPTYMIGRPIPPWNFAVIRALSGETINGQETMVTRPDGSKVVTLSSSAPLCTKGGVITGAAILFQDITKQKTIEQQKNEFIALASHELRTPITAIQGFAEILQLKMTPGNSADPVALRAMAHIIEQSEQLTQLIEEMLDITRIENAQLPLRLAPYNLVDTLTHVIESQAMTTRKHTIRLTLQGLEVPDTLVGNFDEKRIIQVVSNLISNAIKYSPAGGEIEVGLRYTPEQAVDALIWVKDQGIGIPGDELLYVFERFRRASNLDHSISGLGLGLYLVKELVTRHGGRVWVESSVGNGSIFYIRLPLNRDQQ